MSVHPDRVTHHPKGYCLPLSKSLAWEMTILAYFSRSKGKTYFKLSKATTFIARWTIGSARPGNQHTGISPTSIRGCLFHKNSRSPRWKAGAMDSDMTTTIGCGEPVITINDFQSINGSVMQSRTHRAELRGARYCLGAIVCDCCGWGDFWEGSKYQECRTAELRSIILEGWKWHRKLQLQLRD